MIFDLQKPSFYKRISAALFDFIILVILSVGFATVVSLMVDMDFYFNKHQTYMNEYGINQEMTAEEFEKLSVEEQKEYTASADALKSNKDFIKNYNIIFNLMLIIPAVGILIAVLIWEFIIPLIFKNGQTLGKKIFGVALMRTNGVKISPVALFIRSILGKYTFEIMVPVFAVVFILFGNMGIFGLGILAILLVAEIISLIVTKTNSALHDLLADTVTVDLASQLIFENEHELIKFKEEQHAKSAEKTDY